MFLNIEERFARPPPPPSVFDRCEKAFGFCEGLCGVTTVDDRCRLFFRHLFDDFDFLDFSDDRCTKSSFGKKTGFIFSNFPKTYFGPGASEKPFASDHCG